MTELMKNQLENNHKKIIKDILTNIKKLKDTLLLYHEILFIVQNKNLIYNNKKYHYLISNHKNNLNNCNNYDERLSELKDEIEELLIKLLPHGSGIDCNWNFEFYNNGNIDCTNFYHVMNNNGYYVKYIPIKIKFYRYKKNIYRYLTNFWKRQHNRKYGLHKKSYQIIEKKDEINYKIFAPTQDYYVYNLQDYLYQTMDSCLKPYITIKRNNDKYIKTINIFDNWKYKKIEKENFKKPYIIK